MTFTVPFGGDVEKLRLKYEEIIGDIASVASESRGSYLRSDIPELIFIPKPERMQEFLAWFSATFPGHPQANLQLVAADPRLARLEQEVAELKAMIAALVKDRTAPTIASAPDQSDAGFIKELATAIASAESEHTHA